MLTVKEIKRIIAQGKVTRQDTYNSFYKIIDSNKFDYVTKFKELLEKTNQTAIEFQDELGIEEKYYFSTMISRRAEGTAKRAFRLPINCYPSFSKKLQISINEFYFEENMPLQLNKPEDILIKNLRLLDKNDVEYDSIFIENANPNSAISAVYPTTEEQHSLIINRIKEKFDSPYSVFDVYEPGRIRTNLNTWIYNGEIPSLNIAINVIFYISFLYEIPLDYFFLKDYSDYKDIQTSDGNPIEDKHRPLLKIFLSVTQEERNRILERLVEKLIGKNIKYDIFSIGNK